MVTQLSVAPNGAQDRMSLGAGYPILGVGYMTTTETNKLIGEIDRRFNAVCWDMDRLYRFYSLGGIMVPLLENECPPVREIPIFNGQNTNFAWSQNCEHDLKVFNDLWNEKETQNQVYLNHFINGNKFYKGSFNFTRNDKVLLFKDKEKDG